MLVTIPPQHGKSSLISRYFPAWHLGTFPDRKVILASYEAGFASYWGGQARDVLLEHGPELFGIEVNQDSSAKNWWHIRGREGYMATAGIGGPVTGKGADLLIIDDPLKNKAEASSTIIRQGQWDWFITTAATRMSRRGRKVILMTRWNEDDLAGRVLKAQEDGGDKWKVLRLPAIAEQDEDWGTWKRHVGEALCPQLHPLEKLLADRHRQGEYWFSSMYQQRPSPMGGGIFKRKWFKYYQVHGDGRAITCDSKTILPLAFLKFFTIDLAFSQKDDADYVAIGIWSYDPTTQNLYLLDVVHERMEAPDFLNKLKELNDKWNPAFVGIETVQAQLGIVQLARRIGIPVRELRPDKDKVSRAMTSTSMLEGGRVWFPQFAAWLGDLEAELLSFDKGLHDDLVDMLTYAVNAVGVGGMAGTGELPAPVSPSARDKVLSDMYGNGQFSLGDMRVSI